MPVVSLGNAVTSRCHTRSHGMTLDLIAMRLMSNEWCSEVFEALATRGKLHIRRWVFDTESMWFIIPSHTNWCLCSSPRKALQSSYTATTFRKFLGHCLLLASLWKVLFRLSAGSSNMGSWLEEDCSLKTKLFILNTLRSCSFPTLSPKDFPIFPRQHLYMCRAKSRSIYSPG